MAINETQYSIDKLDPSVLPQRGNESWKYTRLDHLLENQYHSVQLATNINTLSLSDENYYLVNINEEGLEHNLPSSVEIDSLQNNKFENTPFNNDIATHLTQANNKMGYQFSVVKNSSLDKPIMIKYDFKNKLAYINLHNEFIVNSGSKLEVFEDFSSSVNVFVNYMAKPTVESNANFNHVIIQDTKYGSLFLHSYDGKVLSNGTLDSMVINLGAKLSRSNVYINLADENASCSAHGLYALHRDQHHDTSSYIHHSMPHTYSFQLYKGIMDDESHGVFTGKVRVEKDAQLITAEQLNKNLLLSNKAKVNSRPQLEIYADDVKCAHGSTTGQMSEDELFYFESRGIKKEKARGILARAFAYDVVLKQKNLTMRSEIINHLIQKNIVRA